MWRLIWICVLSLIVVFPLRIVQKFESNTIFEVADFYSWGRVTQDGKNEGLFGRFFRLLKSKLESLLMIFLPTLRQSRGLVKMSIDFMITGATTKAIQKTISLGAVGCIRIVVQNSET